MDNVGLIGKKIGMSREFFSSGTSVPVTIIKIEKGRVIDLITKDKKLELNSDLIWSTMIVMLSNRYIWENESNARDGGNQDLNLLKLTHSINGVRNTAKNLLSKQLDERVDLKIDCLAAELKSEFQNWDIFENDKQ